MKDISVFNKYYEQFGLLLKTRHAIFRAREKELIEYDISPEHALILASIIKFGDKATTANISQDIFREFHTIFAQLKIMEKEGLVNKIYDYIKSDRFRFVLTEKGKEKYEKSTRRESINRIMSVLSEEEHQNLCTCLEKLLNVSLKELKLEKFEYKADKRR